FFPLDQPIAGSANLQSHVLWRQAVWQPKQKACVWRHDHASGVNLTVCLGAVVVTGKTDPLVEHGLRRGGGGFADANGYVRPCRLTSDWGGVRIAGHLC